MYRQDASLANGPLITAFAGQVFGIERTSGKILWVHHVDQNSSEIELVIADGVVIACGSRSLMFVDYLSGRPFAHVALVGEWIGRPTMVLEDGHLYIGRLGELSCYTARGEFRWVQPFKGHGVGSHALGFPGNVRQSDDRGSK